MSALPVVAVMSPAVCSPASVLRTASVTVAPAPARARAVSTPMPDAAPVTTTRRPLRSMPAATSAAVDSRPNSVVMSGMGDLRVEREAEASSANQAHYRRHPPFYKEVLAGLVLDQLDAVAIGIADEA